MPIEQTKQLIPEKSFVGFASGKYRFVGLYPEGHFLRNAHLMIYDEPPTLHVDSVNIDSCEFLGQNTQ